MDNFWIWGWRWTIFGFGVKDVFGVEGENGFGVEYGHILGMGLNIDNFWVWD